MLWNPSEAEALDIAPLLRAAVQKPACAARPEALSFLWGFRFSETSRAAPYWVLEMHGWLTLTLNESGGFQGFHGWHQDGPGPVGRYHKAFVMVSKNRTTHRGGADAVAAHTNLAAVPAVARYAHNCAYGEHNDPQRLMCDNTQMR